MPSDTSWPISVTPPNRLQRAGGVQRQQRADGESRENDDGEGTDADQVRLLQHISM